MQVVLVDSSTTIGAYFDAIGVYKVAQYNDGTTVESWKPAQAGADKTAGQSIDVLTNGTYGKPLVTYLSNGRPIVNLADGIHSNLNLQYVSDAGGRYAAAESGADKTANHTSADTTYVNGRPSSTISYVVQSNGMIYLNSGSRMFSLRSA
jgi:hypothetical protein